MSEGADGGLDRRKLLALLGVTGAGALTWDVVRAGASVDVTSAAERPAASDAEIAAYVRSCTAFGLDLLDELLDADAERNLLLSPVGLSGVLAMTWAGARGETEQRMSETLHFPHGQDRLHPTVGALQYDLDHRGSGITHRPAPEIWEVNRFELRLANVLWGQSEYPFRRAFLDTLEDHYGSELRSMPFSSRPETARQRINQWGKRVSDGRVEELLPPESITQFTRFVLTNSVFLRADWKRPFDPDETEDGTFTRPDGTAVEVPMMHQEGEFPFVWVRQDQSGAGIGYRAVELPYIGGTVSMVLVVPARDRALADLERRTDAAWVHTLFQDLDDDPPGEVAVTMPRFTFGNDLALKKRLESLGMTTAFVDDRANFEGMTDPPAEADGLHLEHVFHETHVTVDEEGTVAVAVSASVAEQVSAPPSITLDRPFLFFIRDRETDAVLFLGRVIEPADS